MIAVLVMVWPAQARNDMYMLPINAAQESTEAGQRPDGSVQFFFGTSAAPKVVTSFASVTPHGKASTRGRDDIKACNAAFQAALLEFQKRAKKVSANAVVNIVSYYKKVEVASATEFECHAGAAAHVILRGELAKIAEP